jgi:hypothetical protein
MEAFIAIALHNMVQVVEEVVGLPVFRDKTEHLLLVVTAAQELHQQYLALALLMLAEVVVLALALLPALAAQEAEATRQQLPTAPMEPLI